MQTAKDINFFDEFLCVLLVPYCYRLLVRGPYHHNNNGNHIKYNNDVT